MALSFARAVVGLVLAPCIALSAVVAPEHVHEADADHARSIVHRHVQPHGTGIDDHDHAELADGDEDIAWVDDVAVSEPAFQLGAPGVAPIERFEPAPALTNWIAKPDYNAAPPHGPPRASLSSRAPPSLSA